jgi:hypothetical protein
MQPRPRQHCRSAACEGSLQHRLAPRELPITRIEKREEGRGSHREYLTALRLLLLRAVGEEKIRPGGSSGGPASLPRKGHPAATGEGRSGQEGPPGPAGTQIWCRGVAALPQGTTSGTSRSLELKGVARGWTAAICAAAATRGGGRPRRERGMDGWT